MSGVLNAPSSNMAALVAGIYFRAHPLRRSREVRSLPAHKSIIKAG